MLDASKWGTPAFWQQSIASVSLMGSAIQSNPAQTAQVMLASPMSSNLKQGELPQDAACFSTGGSQLQSALGI